MFGGGGDGIFLGRSFLGFGDYMYGQILAVVLVVFDHQMLYYYKSKRVLLRFRPHPQVKSSLNCNDTQFHPFCRQFILFFINFWIFCITFYSSWYDLFFS